MRRQLTNCWQAYRLPNKTGFWPLISYESLPLAALLNNRMHRFNLLTLLGVTTTFLALTGCAGNVRYPSYYTLNPPSAPAPESINGKPVLGSLAVRKFVAPSFLRAGPIVYRRSAEQVDFYHYHRWAADPRSAVTNAVAQNIRDRQIFSTVQVFDGRGASDYLVTGTIDHLEEVDQDHDVVVDVSLSAQLMNLKTGDILWAGSSSETSKVEHRTVPDVVSEMANATQRAVDHLVSSMQKQIVANSGQAAGGL